MEILADREVMLTSMFDCSKSLLVLYNDPAVTWIFQQLIRRCKDSLEAWTAKQVCMLEVQPNLLLSGALKSTPQFMEFSLSNLICWILNVINRNICQRSAQAL